jgi:hypothetical protein
MQMPSWIGVCGVNVSAAADALVAVPAAAVVLAAVVPAEVPDAAIRVAAIRDAGAASPAVRLPRVAGAVARAGADVVAVPTPARTMLAVSAAEPAKSDRFPIATSVPFHPFCLASA